MNIQQLLGEPPLNTQVQVKGWIRTKRESGKITFLEINDGSCLKNLQVLVDQNSSIEPQTLAGLRNGTSCVVSGLLVESPVAGQTVELQASEILIYAEAPCDYILQKKRHSFEFLRDIAHLRARTNTFGAMLRVRNALSMNIHNFFQSRGFLWVHTPILTANDAEGAGEVFQVTTLNLEELKYLKENETINYSKDFFGRKTGLTVSGQLNGEALALAMGKIYTFGPTFRAENSNTSRHLSEFWMVEPEVAFYELQDIQKLAEDMLKYCIQKILEDCPEDMAFFDNWLEKGLLDKLTSLLKAPFHHITYTQAIETLKPENKRFQFPVAWGKDLQAEHEKFLTEEVFKTPVIVTDYPKEIKAFYMKANEDGQTVKAMDVLVPRMGEIIGGSQREDNYERLYARMQQLGIDPNEYAWYLDLRRFGSTPHSGFGLGLERFLLYITGISNIRDAIAFPRVPGNIRF